MFISDLTYQETAVESNNLEGGLDLGASFTNYSVDGVKFAIGSSSSAAGSSTMTVVEKLKIDTLGLTFIGLGI